MSVCQRGWAILCYTAREQGKGMHGYSLIGVKRSRLSEPRRAYIRAICVLGFRTMEGTYFDDALRWLSINNSEGMVYLHMRTIDKILMTHMRRILVRVTMFSRDMHATTIPFFSAPPATHLLLRSLITLHSYHNKPSRTTGPSTIFARTRFDTRKFCTVKRTHKNE